MAASANSAVLEVDGPANDEGSALPLDNLLSQGDAGDTRLITDYTSGGEALDAAAVSQLLEEQCRAYDIVDMHLQQFLSGVKPPQLRMFIPGEGGVGKSMTVQTVTANFISQEVGAILVKGAYTGIAASAINGKTLHFIAMLPLNGGVTTVTEPTPIRPIPTCLRPSRVI